MLNTEHTAIIQQIAQNLGDQAVVTGLLTQLSNDYTATLTRIGTLEPLLLPKLFIM